MNRSHYHLAPSQLRGFGDRIRAQLKKNPSLGAAALSRLTGASHNLCLQIKKRWLLKPNQEIR